MVMLCVMLQRLRSPWAPACMYTQPSVSGPCRSTFTSLGIRMQIVRAPHEHWTTPGKVQQQASRLHQDGALVALVLRKHADRMADRARGGVLSSGTARARRDPTGRLESWGPLTILALHPSAPLVPAALLCQTISRHQ